MSDAVGYGAFIIAIVTAVVTVYSSWLSRQSLRQEANLRAKEHAQLSMDMSYRLLLEVAKDYAQDPYIIHYRREAAIFLLNGFTVADAVPSPLEIERFLCAETSLPVTLN